MLNRYFMNKDSVIIGWGTVGKAIAEAFGIKSYYSRTDNNITLQECVKKKYIHICLPTPTVNGACYTDGITDTIKKLLEYGVTQDSVFIIHSTVFAGYNRSIQKSLGIKNIVSNPEFLSEDTAIVDAQKPALIVIGADEPRYREMVFGIYSARFKYIKPIVTDSITAEFLKLSLNAFFTTKVIFANEIFTYAQTIGANYEIIKLALQAHPWGSINHFAVHHKGGKGAGGKCLPKDIEALAESTGSPLFAQIYAINEELLRESGKK